MASTARMNITKRDVNTKMLAFWSVYIEFAQTKGSLAIIIAKIKKMINISYENDKLILNEDDKTEALRRLTPILKKSNSYAKRIELFARVINEYDINTLVTSTEILEMYMKITRLNNKIERKIFKMKKLIQDAEAIVENLKKKTINLQSQLQDLYDYTEATRNSLTRLVIEYDKIKNQGEEEEKKEEIEEEEEDKDEDRMANVTMTRGSRKRDDTKGVFKI